MNRSPVQDDDAVASPVAIGTVVADRYRVDRVIGSGGMGVVVQATHVVLQQPVAIKFLRREALTRADAIERFVREARAAAKVQSDFVVRVQDVALLDDGTPYIVMEYVEGHDLGVELADRGPLPLREAVAYLVQTCEALVETHAAGIIHGDLKPENLYLARSADGGRRVKLLDFGISRISVDRDNRSGLAAGTPAYMAPEQFLDGAADIRTDSGLSAWFSTSSSPARRLLGSTTSMPSAARLRRRRCPRSGAMTYRPRFRRSPSAAWRRILHVGSAMPESSPQRCVRSCRPSPRASERSGLRKRANPLRPRRRWRSSGPLRRCSIRSAGRAPGSGSSTQ